MNLTKNKKPSKHNIRNSAKSRFIEFFEDVDGELSIKRLLSLFFGILFIVVVVGNMFWHTEVNKELITALVELEFLFVAGIASEKFTARGRTSIQANDEVMLKEVEKEEKIS